MLIAMLTMLLTVIITPADKLREHQMQIFTALAVLAIFAIMRIGAEW